MMEVDLQCPDVLSAASCSDPGLCRSWVCCSKRVLWRLDPSLSRSVLPAARGQEQQPVSSLGRKASPLRYSRGGFVCVSLSVLPQLKVQGSGALFRPSLAIKRRAAGSLAECMG